MKNKYNIGDTVFYMKNDKILSGVISGIVMDYKEGLFGHLDFHYSCDEYSNSMAFRLEKYLFPSKEELLASL